MTITETELTNALIEELHNRGWECHPEAHYNHYGDRGVADLFATRVDEQPNGYAVGEGHVFEIKSEAALSRATGANDIIQQFNRMRTYFFRDESWHVPDGRDIDEISVKFELAYIPTRRTLEHVQSNAPIYNSAVKSDTSYLTTFASTLGKQTRVTFRHPKQVIPPLPLTENSDSPKQLPLDLDTPIEKINPEVASALF